MNKISDQIAVGAKAFLTTEYKYLTIFVIIVAAVLFLVAFVNPPSGDWADGLRYSLCFLAGGFLSASAGWRGMATATVRLCCCMMTNLCGWVLLRHESFSVKSKYMSTHYCPFLGGFIFLLCIIRMPM